MRFQLPPQIFQQSQMAPPASVEPPMPQYPSNNPAIFQALQEKHAKLTSAAQKAQEKAQKLLEEAGQLKAPEQAQPMGYRDILPVGGLMLIAKLLGAKDRDLGEGLAGFAQGRQGWAQGENQTRIRNFEQQREALLNQGNMAQGQYSDLLKQALGAESQMFDVQKDERNYEQQLGLANAKKKDPWESLNDDYFRRIGGMPEGPEKAEAATLYRQFVNKTLDKDGLARLDAITLGKNTIAETGKALDNQAKEKKLAWMDQDLELEYNLKNEQLGIAQATRGIKELDLENYPENLRWKRWIMELQGTNIQSTINNRETQNFFNQHKEQTAAASKVVKYWETYKKDIEKRRDTEDKAIRARMTRDLDAIDKETAKEGELDGKAFKRIATMKKYAEELLEVKNKYGPELERATNRLSEALKQVPDPFDPESVPQIPLGQGAPGNNVRDPLPTDDASKDQGLLPIGAGAITPNGTKPGGLPPIADPKTGKEVGTTQRGAAGANQKVNTKPSNTKKTTAKVGDKLKGSGKFTFGGKK